MGAVCFWSFPMLGGGSSWFASGTGCVLVSCTCYLRKAAITDSPFCWDGDGDGLEARRKANVSLLSFQSVEKCLPRAHTVSFIRGQSISIFLLFLFIFRLFGVIISLFRTHWKKQKKQVREKPGSGLPWCGVEMLQWTITPHPLNHHTSTSQTVWLHIQETSYR